jgi:hypothetical protein
LRSLTNGLPSRYQCLHWAEADVRPPIESTALSSERQSAGVIAVHQIFHHNVLRWAVRLSRLNPGGGVWSSSMGMMYFEDLNVGDSWASSECPVDYEEMLTYNRTYDPWPFHVNPEAAVKSPFGGLIASGGYTISLMYRLFHQIANQPDRTWAFLGGFDWHLKFAEPVFR